MAGISEEFKLDFKFGGNLEFITRLEALMKRIDEKFDSVEESMTETAESTDEMADSVKDLNRELNTGIDHLQAFGDRLKDVVKYYVSFAAAKRGAEKVWEFGRESMDAYSTQERAENQLKGVLRNRGSLNQFEEIKNYAAEIQKGSIYGDEAMIKGAGELATYVKGTDSLKSMMKLLTDYAAGMTGGGEVSPDQMESLATGLGMAYDGNYMAMRRKGFDTSKLEALDAILETGGRWGSKEKKKYGDVLDDDLLKQIRSAGGVTEQMRVDALKESLGDWENLSDTVNDLSSSAIVKFNNKLGDLRENLGKRIYPVFNKLVKTIDDNMPAIESFFGDVGEIFESMVTTISENIGDIISFGKNLMSIVTSFAKGAFYALDLTNKLIGFREAMIALVGVLAVQKVYDFVTAMKVAMATMVGAEGASTVGGLTGAFGKLSTAMHSTAGKMVLMGGALWGIQKVVEGVMVAMDAYEAHLNAKKGELLGEEARKWEESNGKLRKSIEEAKKKRDELGDRYPNGFQLDEKDPNYEKVKKDYEKYRKLNAEIIKAEQVLIAGKNKGKELRSRSQYYFNKNAKDVNPMDAISKEMEAAAKAVAEMEIDAKGNVNMYNRYQNTNIEQNVTVAADLQKIGIMLNQNIRSIIEKQLRRNSEVSVSNGV